MVTKDASVEFSYKTLTTVAGKRVDRTIFTFFFNYLRGIVCEFCARSNKNRNEIAWSEAR